MASTTATQDTATVPALRLTRRFAAPRQAVFDAWTKPEELSQWFGPKGISVHDAKVDVRSGGSYSLKMVGSESTHLVSGVYREVTSPERLVFSWIWGNGDFEGVEMQVTLEFEETKDGGTLLTLTHEHLPSPQASEHHNNGWLGCFDSLQEHLAK